VFSVTCDTCKKELDQPGGLLFKEHDRVVFIFSPPDAGGLVIYTQFTIFTGQLLKKEHICCTCYKGVRAGLGRGLRL